MADDGYRALLTDREREIISGEADVSDSYRYRVVSRVREKIERLEEDAVILRDHHPELFDELDETLSEIGSQDDETE